MKIAHNRLDFLFNFSNFDIQFTDVADGVLQFKGLGGYPRTNRISGGVPGGHSHIPLVAAFRGGFK